MHEFEGTSETSNFQEALENAIKKALGAVSHTEPMVSYTVKRIGGKRGGLGQLNKLTVVIETDHTAVPRETRAFIVESCESCGKKHRLTIEFTPLS
jgi:hypothetical protein